MTGQLRRLTVFISHQIPGSSVCKGLIWGVYGLVIAPVFAVPWLIGVLLVSSCHCYVWDTDTSRERVGFEVFLQSHRWVVVVFVVVTLVLFSYVYL